MLHFFTIIEFRKFEPVASAFVLHKTRLNKEILSSKKTIIYLEAVKFDGNYGGENTVSEFQQITRANFYSRGITTNRMLKTILFIMKS